ncbi:MAG: hypothetical protein JWO13_1368 [Acidobacteriales bacterium]|nr:hypothetical protein [Terriglobales bacterium]
MTKPLPFVVPKKPKIPQRAKGVRRMTIIAGFSGWGGVVLCADTQETVSGYGKREVEKISVGGQMADMDFNVAVAAATDSGPHADSLTGELIYAVSQVKVYSLSRIKEEIEKKLAEYHAKHIWPRASQDRPHIETIVVIQHAEGGHADMFHTTDTAVNWVSGSRCCIGVGSHLGDFILERTLQGAGSKSHMLAVAAHMLKEVRENIDGCGKNATIWFFGKDGTCEQFYNDRFKFMEDQVEDVNDVLKEAMRYMTDVEEDSDGEALLHRLDIERRKNREHYEQEMEQERKMEEWRQKMKDGTEDAPF